MLALVAGLLSVTAALPAAAAMPEARDAGAVVDSGKTRSRLIPAGDHVILHLSPDKGWHTYWTNPGDSGMATSISFTLPDGLAAGGMEWPTPDRILYGPLANFGYTNDVYIPVAIKGDIAPGTEIKAHADWLVCEDICVPEGADLSVTMGGGVSDNAALMAKVKDLLPKAGPEGHFAVAGKTIRIEVPWPVGNGAPKPETVAVFPYKDGLMDNAVAAKWGVEGDRMVVEVARGPRPMPDAFNAVLKVQDTGYDVALTPGEVAAVPVAEGGAGAVAAGGAAASTGGMAYVRTLLFAFIGGIILNLMPCVFPVLSIKAMALAQSAGRDDRARRVEGLVYTAGVLVSFAIIGGLLLALRAGGEAIGWGFQLQSPVFVTIMAFILFTMGLSFSGLFSLGGGFTGVGQSLTEHRGHSGAFFTGALATLVATPCTAPFMATALGLALVLPAAMAVSIFLMLGLGLAFPILLLSFSPAFGRMLPRPGDWMVTFRQFLSFLLYATVVWLLWVLGRQVGVDGLALALFGLVLIAFLVWLLRAMGAGRARLVRGAGAAAALLLLVTAVGGIAALPAGGQQAAGHEDAALSAEVYNADRLQQYLNAGDPVFVNFTADWCITCLANERVALSSGQVKAAFETHGVRYMKGDWTNRDGAITAMLQKFGRSGVPLYLYYPAGAGADAVQVLPQILTPSKIVEVLSSTPPRQAAQLTETKTINGG
jgi:thiol:disulfide interchange protein DsbD